MKKNRQIFIPLGIAIVAILITQIIGKSNNNDQSQAAAPSAKISFPQDHLFHSNFKNEWWYLNLMVRSSDNKNQKNIRDNFYVISFSKISGISGLLTSKFNSNSNSFNQKTNYPGTLTSTINSSKLLTISFSQKNGTSMTLKELSPLKNGAKRYSLKGTSSEIGTIDLILTERTINKSGSNTPLLWGCTGNISVFSPNDTFYYSIPDLDITGKITDTDKTSRSVTVGKAWMDHQWFNSTAPSDWKGHYWSNQYLTTKSDFTGPHTAFGFVTQIYKNGSKYSYWVKRNPDGTNECGTNLKITPMYSSDTYPLSLGFDLKDSKNKTFYQGQITTFSSNQIFNQTGIPEFIEQASYVTGTIKNTNYTGLGFFETSIKK